MIVKIIVLISQPVRMELVFRKRIATTIGKSEGWWSGKAMKYLMGYVNYFRFTFQTKSDEFSSFRNRLNVRASFMKLFQVFRNTFTKSKIDKV